MKPILVFDAWSVAMLAVFIAAMLSGVQPARAAQIYSNSFNGPIGTSYPESSSSIVTYASMSNPPGSGTLPAPVITNTVSPNNEQRFLGEFGGPPIGVPGDPGYNHTRVDQTISLSLSNLQAHGSLQLAFDLYTLKSWDGNSPAYGRDRFILNVTGGPRLLDTTFSNNPKTDTDGSYQDYPAPVPTVPISWELVLDKEPLTVPNGQCPDTLYDPEAVLALIYTSGTTDHPKGVMVTHANVLANIHFLNYWIPHNEGGRYLHAARCFGARQMTRRG